MARHVEDFRGVSIGAIHREMKRLGLGRESRERLAGRCTWPGATYGAGLSVSAGSVAFDFRTARDAIHHATAQLTWKACRLGGWRPWFVCPACGRTVGTLYLEPFGVRCRHCLGVRYRTQDMTDAGRLNTQADKVRDRLNADGTRPKGMRQATYERLRDRERQYREAGRTIQDLDREMPKTTAPGGCVQLER